MADSTIADLISHAGDSLKALPNYGQVMQQRAAIQMQQQALREHNAAYAKQQATDQRQVTLGTMAAGGDVAGAQKAALGAGDFDLANHFTQMQAGQRDQVKQKVAAGAQVLYGIKTKYADPAQRAQAIQGAIPYLKAQGYTDDEIARLPVDDTGINGALTGAQTISEQIAAAEKAATLQETHRGNTIKLIGDGLQGGFTPSADLLSQVTDSPSGGFSMGGGGPASSGGGGSLGNRNGNPGNIRDGKFAQSQPGYLGPGENGFAKFAPGYGEKAQESLLRGSYLGKGVNTVDGIINKYAPAGENSAASQANYKSYVAGKLGLRPGDIVPLAKLPQLAQAMREFETGNTRAGPTANATVNNTFTITPGGKLDKSPDTDGTPQLSPQAIDNAATVFNEKGTLPTMGMGKPSAVLKAQILNRAAELARANGDSGTELLARQAERKANQTALTDLTKRNNTMSFQKQTAIANGNLLVSAAGAGAGTTGSPLLNRWQQAYRSGVQGSPEVAKFGLAMNTFANEYAKVISGATGAAGVAEGARQEMLKHLSEASTPQQVAAIVKQAKLEMESAQTAVTKQLQYTQSALRAKPPTANGGNIPTMTPEQVRAAPKGTRFRTTDARVMVRQ